MTEDEWHSPAAMLERLKEASLLCAQRAQRFRDAAQNLTETIREIRSISHMYVDPEDVDQAYTSPYLLACTDVQRVNEVDHLDRVALSLYAQAGVWDHEAEIHAARIAIVAREVSDGAA